MNHQQEAFQQATVNRERADALQRELQDKQTVWIRRHREMNADIQQAEGVIVDALIDGKKADTAELIRLKAEGELALHVVNEVGRRVHQARIDAMNAKVIELRTHADLQRDCADQEEAKAAEFLSGAPESLRGASLAVQNSTFDKRRRYAAELDMEAERTERQAAQIA